MFISYYCVSFIDTVAWQLLVLLSLMNFTLYSSVNALNAANKKKAQQYFFKFSWRDSGVFTIVQFYRISKFSS